MMLQPRQHWTTTSSSNLSSFSSRAEELAAKRQSLDTLETAIIDQSGEENFKSPRWSSFRQVSTTLAKSGLPSSLKEPVRRQRVPLGLSNSALAPFQRTTSTPIFAASPSMENLRHLNSNAELEGNIKQYIHVAIEESREVIDLSNMSLLSVPKVLEELKFMPTCMQQPKSTQMQFASLYPSIHLFLQGNVIQELPKFLFRISGIKALVVRNNKLTEIPQEIKRLKQLEVLSLGGNELRFLPAEIKSLRLSQLIVEPNPFLSAQEMQELNHRSLLDSLKLPSSRQCHSHAGSFAEPSLFELCARKILVEEQQLGYSCANVSGMPLRIRKLLSAECRECSICSQKIHLCYVEQFKVEKLVVPVEATTGALSSVEVPLRYILCSSSCLDVFRNSC